MESKNSIDIDYEMESTRKFHSKRILDTMKPGADNQDNVCESTTDSSVLSSVPANREVTEVPPTPPISLSIPPFRATTAPSTMGHQLLVDPSTGQHYLVPSASNHPQPQIFYQPFYYAASPAQPIYYTQGTYLVAPFASGQHSGVQGISMLTHPGHYHVTTSASSPSPSMPSYTSNSQFDFGKNTTVDGRQGRLNVSDSKFVRSAIKHPLMSTLAQLSEKDKYASHISDSSQEHAPTLTEHSVDVASVPSSESCSSSPKISETHWNEHNYSAGGRLKNEAVEAGVNIEDNNKSMPRPVRMDIDLNATFVDDEIKRKEKNKAAARAPSTAFTVTFDSNESCNLSLQDAARRSGTRRLLRRSFPTAISSTANVKLTESTDPKRYLLNKMLMGDPGKTQIENAPAEVFPNLLEARGAPDVDTLSEAGTYVVDDDNRLVDHMVSSQQLSDDDASGSSSSCSDRTVSPSAPSTNLSQITVQRGVKSTDVSIQDKILSDGLVCERKFLPRTQLRGLTRPFASTTARSVCRGANQQTSLPSTPVARLCSAPSGSARYHSTSTASYSRFSDSFQPSNSNVSSTGGASFRREGGRFSMRGIGSRANLPPTTININKNLATRPPFRTGTSKGIASSVEVTQKESAEMTAWLRRKDYNPMKAAAEARRMQQLKSRADQYTSNRSISFHQGSKPDSSRFSSSKNSAKSIHINSNQCLPRELDIYGSDSTLINYTKEMKDDFKKLRWVDDINRSELPVVAVEKTIQELSLKCNRSIELIKKTHHGRLTGSVESLLQLAVDPSSNSHKSITEQLDQLSSAFDAIQKYLEVYSSSASTPASPSGGSPLGTPCVPLRSISPTEKSTHEPEQVKTNKDFLRDSSSFK